MKVQSKCLTKNAIAIVLAILISTVSFSLEANSKAAYKSKEEMIKSANVIAYVDITKVEAAKGKGSHWTYGQKATAKPIKVLKGKPANLFTIMGDENFICAQVKLSPGKALVFLNKENGYYTGNNWSLSIRKERNGKIEWFGNKSLFDDKQEDKAKVFAEINSILRQDQLSKMPSYLKPLINSSRITDSIVGEGVPSTTFPIFKKALADKNLHFSLLKTAMPKASPAGKIYLAMIIMKLYPAEAKSIFDSLAHNQAEFEFQSGCEVFTYSIDRAINELKTKGRLMTLVPGKL